jgi:[ribosomal protein S5]-alanine N-acetyltransferase
LKIQRKMKEYLLKTERLGLRKWMKSDFKPFAKMNADPEVMKYYPYLLTEAQSNTFAERIIQQYEKYGYCVYAADLLDEDRFIGYTGFMKPSFESYFTPCVEIGWRLDSSVWNLGLATEGALACLNYGFENLGFEKIYSFTSVLNLPSERIMQKIGLQKIDEFEHPRLKEGDRLKRHVLYCAEKSEREPKNK